MRVFFFPTSVVAQQIDQDTSGLFRFLRFGRAIFYKSNPEAATTKASAGRQPEKPDDADAALSCSSTSTPTWSAFPTVGWSSNPALLPMVSASTVLDHLMRTGKACSASEVVVSQKPLRRGSDFFFGGYIHDVQVSRAPDGRHVYMQTKCWASQKKTTKYLQKIIFKNAEDIDQPVSVRDAACEGCPAGQDGGLCQHVFAVLIATEYYGARLLRGESLPGKQAVTSLRQSWGPRARDIEPKAVFRLVYEKSKMAGERKQSPLGPSIFESRGERLRDITDDDVEALCAALASCNSRMQHLIQRPRQKKEIAYGLAPRGSCLYHQLKDMPADVSTVEAPQPAKRSAPVSQTPGSSSAKRKTEESSFPPLPLDRQCQTEQQTGMWTIDVAAVHSLERRTREQSSSVEWRQVHQQAITSSNFKRVHTSKQATNSLLASLFDQQQLDHVAAIQHGRQFEPVAREAYMKEKSTPGAEVRVQLCGVVLHPSFRYLGASPDGLVYDSTASQKYGLLEIKCPYAAYCKSWTVEQACALQAEFSCELIDGKARLRRHHAYYYQVQGQMAVCRAPWCDFFLWLGTSTVLERIYFDEQFWADELLPSLVEFYLTSAVPYLKQLGRAVPEEASSGSRPLNCYETFLRSELCQSRIDGRNGSTACAVICTVFVEKFVSRVASVEDEGDMRRLMCWAMRQGNCLYDRRCPGGTLLSMDEVLDRFSDVGAVADGETFLPHSALPTVIDMLCPRDEPGGINGGVLVITPYSFALLCTPTTFVLFDSHSHEEQGALVAVVPVKDAVKYLYYFFQSHYSHIGFTDASCKAAHLTLLSTSS